MKKVSALILIFAILFAGCEKQEITYISESESSSKTEVSCESPESESSVSQPESSGYENPYTSCVPDWSVSSGSPDPSYVHSTDTSSDISPEENTNYFKGRVVNTLPEYGSSPNAALGRESVLKRWYFAIADTSEISELRVQSSIAEEYQLSFDETFAIIEALRALSPGSEPNLNEHADDSYTVAAYDASENELWRVTLSGSLFILSFGGENASYVFDIAGQNYDPVISAGNFVFSSSRP